MPLHREPRTITEKLAGHLEMNYGLQLDPARHKTLVEELDGFVRAAEARVLNTGITVAKIPVPDPILPEDIGGAVARGWCHPSNSSKEMDGDLAIAISCEVIDLLIKAGISVAPKGDPDAKRQ